MSTHSILLALSGSEQSRNAAEMAWKLSKKLNATVTAEHVIDSRTIWELLRNDKPGFIGSGPYIAVYETILCALKSLAEKLALDYEALANGQGVQGECLIKEGNPVEILSRDAADHNLLVIGHYPSGVKATDRDLCHYIRYSVAEGVSHQSIVPVLIVQSKPLSWESMTIVSEIDHINYTYLRSCLKLAKLLELKPRLEFWGTGTREEGPAEFKKDLLVSMPEAKEMDIEFEYFGGQAATDRRELFHGQDMSKSVEIPSETLFVLPTRGIARERMTVFGMEPEAFIRCLTLPCLLLWPEDHKAFDVTSDLDLKQLSATKK